MESSTWIPASVDHSLCFLPTSFQGEARTTFLETHGLLPSPQPLTQNRSSAGWGFWKQNLRSPLLFALPCPTPNLKPQKQESLAAWKVENKRETKSRIYVSNYFPTSSTIVNLAVSYWNIHLTSIVTPDNPCKKPPTKKTLIIVQMHNLTSLQERSTELNILCIRYFSSWK